MIWKAAEMPGQAVRSRAGGSEVPGAPASLPGRPKPHSCLHLETQQGRCGSCTEGPLEGLPASVCPSVTWETIPPTEGGISGVREGSGREATEPPSPPLRKV